MPKHFISNKDESVRMFKSDILEFFSKVHWTMPLIVYIPIIVFLIYRALAIFEINIFETVILFLSGIFVWTFVEYILHRFLFHYHPKNELARKIHWTFHGVHHDYPQDSKRLVMPPAVSIPLATIFYFIFLFIFGQALINPFFAGFLLGYLFYDMIHYGVHHFGFRAKWLFALKSHHMKHHYVEPNDGYGVSSPLWDIIFGTTYKKSEIIIRIL